MTKYATTADFASFTTDAKFRAWVLAGETALAGCGLVRTSDTGQINPATVTKPIATNTKAGYSVWRFNDSLQSTKPIIIKVEYGSGGVASGNSPSIWLTMSNGSDGAGTLTGLVTSIVQSGYTGATAPTNASCPIRFTHSTTNGYLLMDFGSQLVANAARGAGFGIIERTKDASGNPTGSGASMLTAAGAGSTFSWLDRSISFDSSTVLGARAPACGALATTESLSTGPSIALYRHYTWIGAIHPLTGRLSFYSGDIVDATEFTSTPFGSTAHTYKSFAAGTAGGVEITQAAGLFLAYLWED